MIQSATFLSYLSALVLLQGFAAALLAGIRRNSPRLLSLSGALAGTAFFARPYDAVLFGGPFVLWLGWTHRRAFGRLAGRSLWIGLGAALPVAGMFGYFFASTGGWLDTPFNLTHPSDMLGFGSRQMYPGSKPLPYTPRLAWEGISGHLRLMSFWGFGGFGLIALAAKGFRKMSRDHPGRWLALVAISVPVGYFFFWGSVGSIRWGAPTRLGPFYYLPMIAPIVILGAAGYDRLWAKTRKFALLSAVVMLVVAFGTMASALRDNHDYTQKRRELYGPLLTEPLDNGLVFLPQLNKRPQLTHPFALARNSGDFSGKVIWALDRGPEVNRRVIAEFPERVPFRLVTIEKVNETKRSKFTLDFTTRLERLPSNAGRSGTVLAED